MRTAAIRELRSDCVVAGAADDIAVLIEDSDNATLHWFGSSFVEVVAVEIDDSDVASSVRKVRVRYSPETYRLGYAGQTGDVMGDTMPSYSGVTAVGLRGSEDYAVAVRFRDKNEVVWFAESLIEPI